MRILAFGFIGTVSLCAQYGHQRFSWQDACFKNPGAPYCQGNDFAVKPTKNAAPGSKATDSGPFTSTPEKVTPSVIVAGGIDWRFADPLADALVGFNASSLSTSPLAHNLIDQLGASQGLTAAAMQKIFEGLSGVNQVAISVRDNQIVVMVTGRRPDSTLPPLQAGWKTVPVSGNAMLVGHAEAVDQAVQRIAMEGAPSELTRSAEERQASSEFWAVGSAKVVGPQAVSAGVKRFSLTFSIRDHLTSEAAFEFNGAPDANTLEVWPIAPGSAVIDGNVVHARMAMNADEVPQKLGQFALSPLGQRLTTLVMSARYLPVRDTTLPKQTKPIIYGLDDGPKEVTHYPNR
jgi:hypothetical protein